MVHIGLLLAGVFIAGCSFGLAISAILVYLSSPGEAIDVDTVRRNLAPVHHARVLVMNPSSAVRRPPAPPQAC
jgi:hypothetical protein